MVTPSTTPPSPNGAKPIDEALKLPSGQIGPLTMSSGLTNIPDPQKHAQLGLRYMASPAEHAICTYRAANGWDHVRPMSVLVCVIGNHYRERSWARIVDMVDFANREGIYCALMEKELLFCIALLFVGQFPQAGFRDGNRDRKQLG